MKGLNLENLKTNLKLKILIVMILLSIWAAYISLAEPSFEYAEFSERQIRLTTKVSEVTLTLRLPQVTFSSMETAEDDPSDGYIRTYIDFYFKILIPNPKYHPDHHEYGPVYVLNELSKRGWSVAAVTSDAEPMILFPEKLHTAATATQIIYLLKRPRPRFFRPDLL